jgi:hypothetical protein
MTHNNKELPKNIIMAFRVCQPGSSYLDIHLDLTFVNKTVDIKSHHNGLAAEKVQSAKRT